MVIDTDAYTAAIANGSSMILDNLGIVVSYRAATRPILRHALRNRSRWERKHWRTHPKLRRLRKRLLLLERESFRIATLKAVASNVR